MLRTLMASALVLSSLTLAPAVASAKACGSAQDPCDHIPLCGPHNAGQVIWVQGSRGNYQIICNKTIEGYFWGRYNLRST